MRRDIAYGLTSSWLSADYVLVGINVVVNGHAVVGLGFIL